MKLSCSVVHLARCKPFDYGADSDHDLNPGLFNGTFDTVVECLVSDNFVGYAAMAWLFTLNASYS